MLTLLDGLCFSAEYRRLFVAVNFISPTNYGYRSGTPSACLFYPIQQIQTFEIGRRQKMRMTRLRKQIITNLTISLFWLISHSQGIEIDRLTINGYTSFEFEQQIESEREGNGDPNGSFDADLFDLVFNFQATDNIRAAADVSWEHGAASEDDRGNVALEYGFVEYTFSDFLKIRFGKMFTPFGVFNEIHTAKPAFLSVKEAAGVNKTERIVGAGYRFFPRWGTGIGFQGDATIMDKSVDYNILIANGEDEDANPFEEDTNESKSVTARVRFSPLDTLRIGNSLYYEKTTEAGFNDLFSEGIELEYYHNHWRLLTEVAIGFKESDANGTIEQVGFYIQPSYQFDNGITPYLRLDYLDPDLDRSADHGFDIITGVNFQINQSFIIKLEHNYFKGAKNSSLSGFSGRDYNEIKAAVVLGF